MVNINQSLKSAFKSIESHASSLVSTAKNTFKDIESHASSYLSNVKGAISSAIKSNINAEVLGSFAEKLIASKLEKIKRKLENKIRHIDKSISSYIKMIEKTFGVFTLAFGTHAKCEYPPHLLQDPYITGYYYVTVDPPSSIVKQVKFDTLKFRQKLGFLCKDMQLPTLTMNHVEKIGYGGVKQQVVSNIDYERSVTLTFYDTYNLEVYKFFKAWFLSIVDLKTGLHLYENQSDFKTSIVVVHADPKMSAIDLDVFIGAHPSQLPLVSQSRDPSIKEIQVTFQFDMWLPTR